MYQVKDVMTDRVYAVRAEATIDDAISLLLDHQVSGLPVVDDQGLLIGVITELDIIDLVYNADIESSIVREYMTRDVSSLGDDASLDEAASFFCNNTIRRIPIVRDGLLVGVLSRRDLIGFLRGFRKQSQAK